VIPRAHITAWRSQAPWPTDAQVEQDLILSRALIAMFGISEVGRSLAFRGGTALYKLFGPSIKRYSEDIDLVQVESGPAGPALNAIRAALDPWLGEPRWKRGPASVSLIYRFETTIQPVQRMRLKVEINTREHFTVLGFKARRFQLASSWFSGETEITSYRLEELLGTKLRALYQRKKGRDLFDLWLALRDHAVNPEEVVSCFHQYLRHSNLTVSRAQFERNLALKMQDAAFLEDVRPLLPSDAGYDPLQAETLIRKELVSRLPGDPWKGSE
jgi:predicted nucleotidyltransferase component of viral defense system